MWPGDTGSNGGHTHRTHRASYVVSALVEAPLELELHHLVEVGIRGRARAAPKARERDLQGCKVFDQCLSIL